MQQNEDVAAPAATSPLPATPGDLAVLAFAAASIGFHVYVVLGGLVPNLISRPLHLLFAIPFVFFFVGGNRSLLDRIASWTLGGLGMAGCLYIVFNRRDLADQYGSLRGLVPDRAGRRADPDRARHGAPRRAAGDAGHRADRAGLRAAGPSAAWRHRP